MPVSRGHGAVSEEIGSSADPAYFGSSSIGLSPPSCCGRGSQENCSENSKPWTSTSLGKTKDRAIDQSCSWSRFQRFNQERPQLPGPFRRPALYTKILLTKEYPQSIGFGNSPPLALKKSTTTLPFRFALPIHFSTRKAHLVLCSSFPT